MTGGLPPYRVWLTATIVVRLSQLIVIVSFLWAMAAAIDAIDPPFSIDLPPFWPAMIGIVLGAQTGNGTWQRRTVTGGVADWFASQWCPSCEHDIFDPTPPYGYHPPQDREAMLPSKVCANCGHDLTRRVAR